MGLLETLKRKTVNWKEYVFANWNIHIDDEDHVAKPRSKSEDQILKFNQRNNVNP